MTALVPVPRDVAAAVVEADDDALARALGSSTVAAPGTPGPRGGLLRAPDWPHDDSVDALRGVAATGDSTGTYLVVVVADGRSVVVGECGWLGPPDSGGDVEIGYGLARSARGRGTGAGAVRLLLDELGRTAGVRRVVARVMPGNEASLRLLRRLGFEPDTSGPDDGLDGGRHLRLALRLGASAG